MVAYQVQMIKFVGIISCASIIFIIPLREITSPFDLVKIPGPKRVAKCLFLKGQEEIKELILFSIR